MSSTTSRSMDRGMRPRSRQSCCRAGGAVLARAQAYSTACRQPDPRANLIVSSLTVAPAAKAGRSRYVALVRNTGRSAAEASSLLVALGGVPLPFAPVAPLEPGESVLVTVEGPACAEGAPIDADADAGEAVDEAGEADNRFTRPCPPPS